MPYTGQLPHSTCIGTNQRSQSIRFSYVFAQKEFVDNVKTQEPLGSSDHNQLHFNIKIKSYRKKLAYVGGILGKEMRTSLAHIDWNDNMKNKTGTESWNILKSELDGVINRYVTRKQQG